MDIKAIKELAQKFSVQELSGLADELENSGSVPSRLAGAGSAVKGDLGDILSDLLQAAEVRTHVDNGLPLQEAVRELSKRVRGVLS